MAALHEQSQHLQEQCARLKLKLDELSERITRSADRLRLVELRLARLTRHTPFQALRPRDFHS